MSSLYLMKFSEGGEVFYKVGHSYKVETRRQQFKKHYNNVEILWVSPRSLSSKDVLIIERFMHKDLKHRRYEPIKYFAIIGIINLCRR